MDKKKETYLCTDDTVTTEERRCKDVHRATLTERHTVLSAHQLGNDTLDGTASEDGESVASVRGDDSVLVGDGGLHTDGNGFLADGKVAETPDKLLLVKGVGGLLHSSHLNLHRGLVVVRRAKRHTYHFSNPKKEITYHGAVHVDQLILGNSGLGRRGVASVRVERVGVELDLELFFPQKQIVSNLDKIFCTARASPAHRARGAN